MFYKIIYLIALVTICSCGQDYNSNSNDQGQYTTVKIDTTTPEGTRFNAAYQVLQSKCMQCHDWSGFNTSDKWIQSGYVIQGNYTGSSIIIVLKNYGGKMPKDPYSALTEEDILSLQSWISNL